MVKTMIELSKQLFPNKPLYLEVRTWNERAIACYQKAGFVVEGDGFTQKTYDGEGTFYRMIRGSNCWSN